MLSTEKIMLGGELGRPFKLAVDKSAELLRAGIDPATGQPALWILFDKDHPEGPEYRDLLVVTTGMPIPAGATHRGMWWGAAETFHLFELESDPALLTNVLGGEESEDDILDAIERNQSPGVDT
jgi:hypothetical protein